MTTTRRTFLQALATGAVMPPLGLLRDAAGQGMLKRHFIEDEHPQSEKQIPRSLEYLASLKL
jgi:hypothetical protein